jgi:hypothetical protein
MNLNKGGTATVYRAPATSPLHVFAVLGYLIAAKRWEHRMRIEPSVWCSNFFYDLEAVKYLDYDYPSPPPKDLWVFGYRNGHHIDPTLLPNQLHMEKTNVELPDIFKATGRVAVARGGLKELLDDFSLGASYFHPVHIFYPRSDREYQGRFYILNIAELRARSLPEHSQRVRLHPNGSGQ